MIYETEEDRTKQAEVKAKIESRFKCLLYDLPYEWRVDYVAVRKNPRKEACAVAWIEVKCRDCYHDAFPSIYLSESKVRKGVFFSSIFGRYDDCREVPFIFVVRFKDGDYYCKITRIKDEWERHNIQARDTEGRIRPSDTVLSIPMEEFKPL